MRLERRRDRAALPDQRVDGCPRVQGGDALEHALAAAHAGEPVVDQRDPRHDAASGAAAPPEAASAAGALASQSRAAQAMPTSVKSG